MIFCLNRKRKVCLGTTILLEDGLGWSYKTGGEYATIDIVIHIDKNLSYEEQQEVLIHSVIENFCRDWSHDKVEELTSEIWDSLIQLNKCYEE
jgi:hypothetical protein